MRINVAVPEAEVTKPVLDSALESVTRLNEQLLASGSVPTFRRALGRGKGVLWKPEPPGDEHFDHAGVVQRRGWGDCDDLAPWHAASLRATGEDPEAVAVVRRSGPTRWHAYVERGNGTTDDPSREAGMGKRGAEGVVGAVLPLMYRPHESVVVGDDLIVRPSIAVRPVSRGYQARVDLPWFAPEPTEYAMTALHGHMLPPQALVGALEGAVKLGLAAGFANPDHVARIGAICDMVEGLPYDEIAACYGDEHARAADVFVGSIFKKGLRTLKKGAKGVYRGVKKVTPIARSLLKFVPVYGPIASAAMDFAFKSNPRTPADAVASFGGHFGKGGFPVV